LSEKLCPLETASNIVRAYSVELDNGSKRLREATYFGNFYDNQFPTTDEYSAEWWNSLMAEEQQ